LVGVVTATSTISAVGLSTGALAGLAASAWTSVSPSTAFVLGFFLPIGPLYLYQSSDRQIRKRLATLAEWKQAKLITEDQFKEQRQKVLQWYAERRLGRAATQPPEANPQTSPQQATP
jgi:hypothetical protein